MRYVVPKAKAFHKEITVPGDKSISHRAVMFSALAKGITEITGLSLGLDVKSTINCLRQMSVSINFENGIAKVYGRGHLGLKKPQVVLDAGNSGTTIRLLSGILAGQKFSSTISGDESLRRRPMKRIIEPLRKMGAEIQSTQDEYAPLTIQGAVLNAWDHRLNVASAQVKSCLLLAGMYARGTTSITEPVKSRDHTERMLSALGAGIGINDNTVTIEGFPLLQALSMHVPGDISSAAFFMVAATLIPNSDLIIKNVGINPTRSGLIDILRSMGASIEYDQIRVINYEPFCDVKIKSAELTGASITRDMIPRLIDELPILAVAATQARSETIIRDAKELRYKESDRIQAIVRNLRKMGGTVEELPDGMIIPGNQQLQGAALDSYGDHRIAMAFAVLGTILPGETVIENAECVEISYPGFFIQLEDLCRGW